MAEVRLIDANALVAEIIEINGCDYGGMFDFFAHTAANGALNDVVRLIDDAPLLDYAPVRHGHWIHCAGKSNLWYCSECGGKIRYNPTRRTYNIEKLPVDEINRFCRSCGAKMEGGNTDA